MQKYPKFLNQGPKFFGLSFLDIVIFCLMTYLGTFLDLNPIVTLTLSASTIFVIQASKKYFDFIGYLNSSRTKTLSWMKDLTGREL